MPVMGGDRADAGLAVALLGPVEIGPAGGTMTPLAQPRLRVLLGLLAAVEGRMVTAEALVDGVWGEEWSPGREKMNRPGFCGGSQSTGEWDDGSSTEVSGRAA